MVLDCVATGVPRPTFEWLKPDGQKIRNKQNSIIITNGSRLTVRTTFSSGDYGQYKCRATNVLGNTEHTISVTQLSEY